MASTASHDSNLHDHSADTTLPGEADMNAASQKGWNAFTQFLLGNVVVTIVTLLLIGVLTVWR